MDAVDYYTYLSRSATFSSEILPPVCLSVWMNTRKLKCMWARGEYQVSLVLRVAKDVGAVEHVSVVVSTVHVTTFFER